MDHKNRLYYFTNKRCCHVFSTGIMTTLGFMGPSIAYALGGVFSRIYVTLEGRLHIAFCHELFHLFN